jgi:hypothetical protein
MVTYSHADMPSSFSLALCIFVIILQNQDPNFFIFKIT